MQVHRSHRMERLVDVLAEVVRSPVGDTLEPETILIQSQGMERWLSNELALRLGVFANARFPFPRAFIDEVFAAVVPDGENGASYSREVLTFAVLTLLPELLPDPAFTALQHYLEDDDAVLKRFQLAERIAYVFDQYLVYRPRLILKWEKGQGSEWQPKLWRAVREHLGGQHFAGKVERFFREWSPLLVPADALPKRVSIVGVSSLPPIYLKVLDKLSERSDIQLFGLSPSREYFEELRSPRELRHTRGSSKEPGFDAEEMQALTGNPLLASWGKSGREFQFLLERDTLYRDTDADLFELLPADNLLRTLQRDIVTLYDRSSPAAEKLELSANDRSVQVMSCHSPMREVEVLRDQLLGMLDDDPTLEPGDMVVMSPTIEEYAPLIDAVFGIDPLDPLYLPYRITDRSVRSENICAKALLQVLSVVSGRVAASEVLDLLQLEPIRERFGIAMAEVGQLGLLVHDAGIRWGLDAEHRRTFDQPAESSNTWKFGLDRLLLGVALSETDHPLFEGTAPLGDVEGDSADLVGKLAHLMQTLADASATIRTRRSVAEWTAFINDLCSRVLTTSDVESWQQRALYDATRTIAQSAEAARFADSIAIDPIVAELESRFETERLTHQFLAGGITFCALLPMRSIPFRVIALLGMNDGEFPRTQKALSFDLIAESPEPGDRSLKDEDRYLFLEALLSARQHFVVSYVGRGVQDNAELPPSPVAAELIDYVQAGFRQGGAPKNPTTEHPLQPFSPRYFEQPTFDQATFDQAMPRLFSFSRSNARGADSLRRQRYAAEPFVRATLAPIAIPSVVELDALILFLQNPARGFLRNRLGVYLEGDPRLIEDREPIELDALGKHELGTTLLDHTLLDHVLKTSESADLRAYIEATGCLPHGTPGSVTYQEIWREVQSIAEAARPWLTGAPAPPLPVRLSCGGTSLTGSLRRLYPSAQVQWQFARVKPKNELALWLRHLVLTVAEAINQQGNDALDSRPRRASVLVGRQLEDSLPTARSCIFDPLPVGEAQRHLDDLVRLYVAGHDRPLPLFPAASKLFAEQVLKAKGRFDEDKALARAREEFLPTYNYQFSEGVDPYVERAFDGKDPFERLGRSPDTPDADFVELSRMVFLPLLQHRRPEEET